MDLSKLSKKELFNKCEELGITKYKSKNKTELILLIENKNNNLNINCKDESIINSDSLTDHKKNKEIYSCKKSNCVLLKPILKWVGGKTQIIDKLIDNFPKEIDNYHEIFLGGGSVLFAFIYCINQKKVKLNGNIYAYDLNKPLIYVYKNIQTKHEELYIELKKLINEYNQSLEDKSENNRNPKNINEAKTSKESYYYWIRNCYNSLNINEKISPFGSAMFIFLNKTCFRGVFREGPNGFNVPYGHYKNPEIVNKEHLDKIHNLIQNVIFECCDYSKSLENIKNNDFVYLDPPYAPENSKSFVGYTKNGFDENNHLNLFQLINKNNKNDIKIMMSNSDVDLVRSNFHNNKYNIESIICKRSINANNPESKTKEVIIKNYNLTT
jgi:DNA adenine methylase